jgi:hypothetical protein
MSSAALTVEKFLERLCQNARYDVQGEKPIAVIAAIKFLNQKKVVGMHLSKIFAVYKQNVKTEFLDLAEKFGRLKNPSGSFVVILGKNGELLKTIQNDPEVDKAFSELSIEDIKQLYEKYMEKLRSSVIEKQEIAPSVIATIPEMGILGTEVIGEFYLLIREFELGIREFIIEMLGKGWIKRLENEIPHVVDKWKKRKEEDYKAGIDPEKNLINYADMTDYAQIIRRYKKVFSESEEELEKVIVNLENLAKHGRNPVMHFRTLTQEGYYTSKSAVKFLLRWMERRRRHRAQNQNPINGN